MKKTNLIKAIIISAVILGEIAVWSFPYNLNPTSGQVVGGADSPAPIEVNESNDNQKPAPDELETLKEAEDTGVLILVNKNNYLDKNYKPEDLAPIEYFAGDRSAEARFMRAEAADHFNKMMLAAREAGYEIVMTTAYRSYGFQSILYLSLIHI